MRLAALLLGVELVAACTPDPTAGPTRDAAPSASATPTPDTTSKEPPATVTADPTPRPPRPLRVATALEAVGRLAGRIGPRPGTSPAYFRAAAWVEGRLETLGYDVRRQQFRAPAGVSWGVPVPAGRSVNLVATWGRVDLASPHLVVGAHLDTVPQAPGAEDNASGVGTLLAVAEAVGDRRTRLPVVLVAFGAEEPRGPTDDDHHYGSTHYVDQLGPAERRAVRGMVALDRVGVGPVVPVCSATPEPGAVRAQLLAAAERVGVPARPCVGNTASDHWSFVKEGMPGARLGSTPYAGYHSPDDVVAVVRPDQLRRAALTTVAWLSGP